MAWQHTCHCCCNPHEPAEAKPWITILLKLAAVVDSGLVTYEEQSHPRTKFIYGDGDLKLLREYGAAYAERLSTLPCCRLNALPLKI